ncbi:MAG: efflux transporter outer membrane subunit [Candidatus Omnitrophica bacterium]|nr:efflux transporter outer membrane subunit [Candidatus Omnitrophota bacterium]
MKLKIMNNLKINKFIVFIPVVGIFFLTGCSVGPNYIKPDGPTESRYTSSYSRPIDARSAQRFVYNQDIPAEWWSLFHCEKLDQVIRMAIDGNPTLESAKAALRKTKEDFNAQVGSAYFPEVNANLSASRQKFSTAAAGISNGKGSIFNLYGASVQVSYMMDIWGGAKRELESLRAKIDYETFQMDAAYLTLTSNIVAAVGKEVAIREQILAVNEIITIQEKQLQILEQQLSLGGISKQDVLSQKSELQQTKAAIPALERELAVTRHYLAVLCGKFPIEESTLPEFTLSELTLPQDLPVTLPSSLVHQRPDIRAAEALLHSASAEIGVAEANLYPQLTLNSGFGPQSNVIKDLFNGNNIVWNIGAGVFQPVFNGGALKAKKRAAVAAFDQASAQYRQTVLFAFQNVADVLRSIETDGSTFDARIEAFNSAKEALTLAQNQLVTGSISNLVFQNSEHLFQQARIGVVQAQAARFTDTAALFQALGGGWNK